MSNFSAESEDNFSMAFVINLADGTGREFYISTQGEAVPLDTPSNAEALILKTPNQVDKQLEAFTKLFPGTCRLYAIERREFEHRQQKLRNPPEKN
ncbi:hypothetical protein [Larkinella humicola]|uniref:Uncharacterized protein n=1 Tax=Larkinella humicola TaxID=2607654 RepID=A0A5N1J558_9BACT|nr:hypothetical protein [Larkinella humicola]KAA9341195.1 hypothetical protein F0P93_30640 [Larkinella humicola]